MKRPSNASSWRILRVHFLTGLIVLIPGVVSAYVVWQLFDWTTNGIPIIAQAMGLPEPDALHVRILGLVGIGLFITGVGMLTRNVVGRRMLMSGEWLAIRTPIFGTVYRTAKQIAATFSSNRRGMFRRAVLFEYPKKDCWVIGFETSEAFPEATQKVGSPLVSVFVPTTPNPTSGFLLFVPQADLIPLKLSIGEAMQLIISGGVVHPEEAAIIAQADAQGDAARPTDDGPAS